MFHIFSHFHSLIYCRSQNLRAEQRGRMLANIESRMAILQWDSNDSNAFESEFWIITKITLWVKKAFTWILKLRQGRLNNIYKSFFELYEKTFHRRAEILLISGMALLLPAKRPNEINSNFEPILSYEKYDFWGNVHVWWTRRIQKGNGRDGYLRTSNNIENTYCWFD